MFGEVLEGADVVKAIEAVSTSDGDNRPSPGSEVVIVDCGEVVEGASASAMVVEEKAGVGATSAAVDGEQSAVTATA